MRNAERQERRDVETTPNDFANVFPVVAVTGDKVQIVWGEELDEFKQKHPDYSFLVPIEKYEVFREKIKTNIRAKLPFSERYQDYSIPWTASFTMEAIAPNRQIFVVDATFDDDRENVGEYEATEKDLFPKYHKFYFGPGQVFVTLPLAVLLTAMFWSALKTAIWLWRRRKRIK